MEEKDNRLEYIISHVKDFLVEAVESPGVVDSDKLVSFVQVIRMIYDMERVDVEAEYLPIMNRLVEKVEQQHALIREQNDLIKNRNQMISASAQ